MTSDIEIRLTGARCGGNTRISFPAATADLPIPCRLIGSHSFGYLQEHYPRAKFLYRIALMIYWLTTKPLLLPFVVPTFRMNRRLEHSVLASAEHIAPI
ncbi:hypothetical protein DL93DRAFT_2079022 [Clavulina sp. PMI_390]|nr:hypothetical protein DL93DRAFT_2079022 [Clavulina sp. PMI_390]